jgi:hypothetical protein
MKTRLKCELIYLKNKILTQYILESNSIEVFIYFMKNLELFETLEEKKIIK